MRNVLKCPGKCLLKPFNQNCSPYCQLSVKWRNPRTDQDWEMRSVFIYPVMNDVAESYHFVLSFLSACVLSWASTRHSLHNHCHFFRYHSLISSVDITPIAKHYYYYDYFYFPKVSYLIQPIWVGSLNHPEASLVRQMKN